MRGLWLLTKHVGLTRKPATCPNQRVLRGKIRRSPNFEELIDFLGEGAVDMSSIKGGAYNVR